MAYLDQYAKKVGARATVALFVLPIVIMFTTTDLPTIFLHHGLVVGILLLALIPASGQPVEGRVIHE